MWVISSFITSFFNNEDIWGYKFMSEYNIICGSWCAFPLFIDF